MTPVHASELIRQCLEKVLSTALFSRSNRQSAFLRCVVENTLSGRWELLKEYEIGKSVYQRGENYDTRKDPIVRVEASRLRAKLREYYDTIGAGDPVRFEMPKGTYVVSFVWREDVAMPEADPVEPAPAPAQPERPEKRVRSRLPAVVAACVGLAIVLALLVLSAR